MMRDFCYVAILYSEVERRKKCQIDNGLCFFNKYIVYIQESNYRDG